MSKIAQREPRGTTSFTLRLIAIATMLSDSLWSSIVVENDWLMYIGKLSFPIFAFLLTEGAVYTDDKGRYIRRIVIFAVLSEIPFDLMHTGHILDVDHQNVLFTLFIGLSCIYAIDFVRKKLDNIVLTGATIGLTAWAGTYVAKALLCDYSAVGIYMILAFYVAKNVKYRKIMEFVCMVLICLLTATEPSIPISLFEGAFTYNLPIQAIAILSLLFIWSYKGDRGPNNIGARYAFYLTYPVHLLILGLLALFGVSVQ